MEHPGNEKLENYVARRLSADEITTLILHLENCADCAAMVKNISQTVENQTISIFGESRKDVFHLDYDEHLRPFVDSEADEATREIVESHTQNCSDCAFQLRELREFAESLRLYEIEKNPSPVFLSSLNEWYRRISRKLIFQIAFLFSAVFLLGFAAFVWLSNENPSQKVAQTNAQPSKNQSLKIESNSNELDKMAAESANKNITNSFPRNQNSIDLTKSQTDENRKDVPVIEDKSAELNGLSKSLRGAFQNAVQFEKITFPAFLSVIGGKLNLRGEAINNPILLYPNAEAIRQISPRFNWQSFAKSNEKYVVEIFDEQNNAVEISPSLDATNWTPKTDLKRGRIYKWEVRTEKADCLSKAFAGKFKVSDQKVFDDIANVSTKSAFVRGIVFASNGLLTEAEKEFRQAIKENDRAALAKKFLRQIEKQR